MIKPPDLPLHRLPRIEALAGAEIRRDRDHTENKIQDRLYSSLESLYGRNDIDKEVDVVDSTDEYRFADVVIYSENIAIECKSTKKIKTGRGFTQAARYGAEDYVPYLASDVKALDETLMKMLLHTDIGFIGTTIGVKS